MTRAGTRVLRMTRGADGVVGRPLRYLAEHPRARSGALSAAAVAVLAVVLIPVRDSLGTANIGLALGLIVGAAGAYFGFGAGLAAALTAGVAFTFLHAVPHGLPRIEEEQDLLTAGLLIVTGAVTGWLHNRRGELNDSIGGADSDLMRLHRLAEAVVGGESEEHVMAMTCDALKSELALASCRWEPESVTQGLRELRHNAAIQGTRPQTDDLELAALLTAGVTISAGEYGQFVLIGRREVVPTRRQLKVAVVMADFAVAACGLPGD